MKFLIRLIIFCVIPFMAMAQTIQLEPMTMEYWTTPNKSVNFTVAIKNISSSTNSYRLKINRAEQVNGHTSTFCFAEQCFGESQNETSGKDGTVVLAPNDVNDSGHMSFFTNNVMVTTILTYTIYNINSESDKLDVKITIHVGTTDVKEEATTPSFVTPNPTSDIATIQVNLPEGNVQSQLVITNNLGQQVQNVSFNGSSTQFSTAALPAGMYNYTVINGGKVVSLGKLAIVR
ncbi:MAG: T9SS type A sorting domain-containing protein [Candidatus Kapabacteria bacterium]|nr:T9SS type A sorting domain-containing protein [Candidatus Kapabacteria bacterium]